MLSIWKNSTRGGKIKGSRWVKREGRPSDEEILTARMIDRSIRPLFPKDYEKDVQVIITVLSVDLENTPDVIAGCAVSAALSISPIPWNGPISMIKVGKIDNKYVTNPQEQQLKESDMEMVVSSTKGAVVMIESASNEVSEEDIVKGIAHAQTDANKVIKLINDFAKLAGLEKQKIEKPKRNTTLEKKVKELVKGKIPGLISDLATKKEGYDNYLNIRDAISDSFEDEEKKEAVSYFEEILKGETRKMILSGKRPDGRKHDEIRELSAEVGLLPRTHGSAIFSRGQTQVLSIATLGAPSLEQFIESATGEETKRYIHHYAMPPYSTGETGRVGFPSRREIGHGALAERALLPVIPSADEFPYTIRIVSEVLTTNGSTSMASTCGSSLSLMDAGVPIKAPVAGIAMGLIIEDNKKFKVLTDILGFEDGSGDMDFKVAGTESGINALQLDVKTLNLTLPILKSALEEAKKARKKILKVMLKAINKPRTKVSAHAPKIKVVKIPQEKIGEVIGPGGRIIRGIIEETGAQVDVDDDGSVNVSAAKEEALNTAVEKIEALVKEVEAGEIYEGEVKRIQPYGAFVEILPGKDGLVHISDMSSEYVNDPNEIVKIGEKVQVRVKEIDAMGRINLSMLLDKKDEEKKNLRRKPSERFNQNRQRRYSGGGRRGPMGRGRHDRKPSGPHFPTSRLLNKRDFSR